MDEAELNRWFDNNRIVLETAYLAGSQPWQQSGVGLRTPRTAQDWEVLRRPIADCISSSGTFLDIGCANGYLLECVLRWTQERNLQITPYGLDFSEKLATLARQRLPQYAGQIFVGNAWNWSPPQRFDYVNTTLDYIPASLHQAFVQRLLEAYVLPGGYLLVAEYLGKHTASPELKINEQLRQWGFSVAMVKASQLAHDPMGQTRIAAIKNKWP
ncbi:class I SAM-dependent methyltransferase [Ktedonosporobacter rubrisoli]|uniref:Class I SAM-dependent methyltransferase n=1 Tax=Ktedonosporobacter rubrisoli TaxID=2509675 RepID=A0A4P6JUW7_KTERU|nr:class I SAM-dependent methyltransferase [Ktedonosporobacter rubrisoli]QBD78736.1 class I SAM-dependent methyltransferase [Ktedonosporobacter rubrisoli]